MSEYKIPIVTAEQEKAYLEARRNFGGGIETQLALERGIAGCDALIVREANNQAIEKRKIIEEMQAEQEQEANAAQERLRRELKGMSGHYPSP